ncbi:MAG: protoheme IX farnesyltransferase [Myxococcales bacterium]|nr:protoheme IX farnesyltransferase [Myxococcales bacterium]
MTAVAATATAPSTLRDLITLTKPRITLLVLITTAGGMWLAGRPSMVRVILTLLGTALVVAGANTLNMYLERDIDGRMARTRDRPLPTRRLRPEVALAMGLALGAVAVPLLTLGVNRLTGLLAAISLILYVLVYTPLKQRSPIALLVGAIPGAMPPLMGWTATTGALEAPGLILFGILFFWQLPHFLAITLFRTDDYARAGFKILAAERGARVAKIHVVIYLAVLVPVSLLLVPVGVARTPYLVAAPVLGAALFAWGLLGLRKSAGEQWARRMFIGSLIYLTLLFGALVAGGAG